MARLGKLLVLLACIAYPFVLHGLILNRDAVNGWQLLVVVLPLLLLGAWSVVRAVNRIWWPLVLLVLVAVSYFIVAGPHGQIGAVAVNGLAHALFNLFLLWLFGRTLLPGREPLITQISRRINGDVVPEIALYTRHVTIAWCIFFAGQVVVSVLLYLFAPISVWSLFINLLNMPLLALMFGGEYLYRTLRYPAHSRTSIMKAIEVYARDMAVPGKTNSHR